MSSFNILPVIMAGGSGSRLWPMSRTHLPKQFLPLVGNETMLQATVNRLSNIEHLPPLFICNEEHRFLVAEQLRQIETEHSGIILEPVGRNTAPAVTLAALKAIENGDDPLLLVLAADHVIKNTEAFTQAVLAGCEFAKLDNLITFGVVPTHPETGYGYIKQGEALSPHAFRVDSFVEKPDIETAQCYLQSGDYHWNSGMFIFKASVFLEEVSKNTPEILESCKIALANSSTDLDFTRVDSHAFGSCPDDSIDYAVMEKTSNAVVVPMDANWSDVGSWSALWDVNDKDNNGNVTKGDILTVDTSNCLIYSQNKLVSTVGVDNLVVVETKDAVLVTHKDKVQDVKNVVTLLKNSERSEYLKHREVFRPWGHHDHIADGERYHVKKVTVKPGERTATQIHHHRAEHWVIVSGTAKVRNGDHAFIISENESTFIPVGAPHSFENPGLIPLELIEVRTGSYLEEDDIIRIDADGEGY
ncbi:mannose-1-phosphate guanylyltransferase/mannose-6-phosphate isomerase [Photobacterium rosenbergii]|uniref:mannose-1-phosphate guanylyltransferase/mannose-6-phosphate isomerase n=1 Tax=Photobacterium rosenbergii TaxID=294936 RepID=UPI001C99A519|nr:mannose-1-phosphate guanylyltransferase/mannose-6-phosphate isomerase [Photobacterium rosenbergii]MBY5947418.1 mannose-1-phosphate guanylyltransferase/mannose-6-phosphate isomerase [Photobacterium rosenbergii]